MTVTRLSPQELTMNAMAREKLVLQQCTNQVVK